MLPRTHLIINNKKRENVCKGGEGGEGAPRQARHRTFAPVVCGGGVEVDLRALPGQQVRPQDRVLQAQLVVVVEQDVSVQNF